MKKLAVLSLLLSAPALAEGLRFAVSVSPEKSATPLDGRLLLMISNDPSAEPRFQIVDAAKTQLAFGIDVEGLALGKDAVFDSGVLGWPLDRSRESHSCA